MYPLVVIVLNHLTMSGNEPFWGRGAPVCAPMDRLPLSISSSGQTRRSAPTFTYMLGQPRGTAPTFAQITTRLVPNGVFSTSIRVGKASFNSSKCVIISLPWVENSVHATCPSSKSPLTMGSSLVPLHFITRGRYNRLSAGGDDVRCTILTD